MTVGVNIKALTPSDDLVACAEMLSRVLEQADPDLILSGLPSGPVSPVKLAGLTMAPGFELHVAEYSLTPVGMARLRTRPGQTAGSPAWYREPKVFAFDLCAVEPAMREMGLGTHLVRAMEKRSDVLGAHELACDIPESAEHVYESLKRFGFRRVDRFQAGAVSRLVLSRSLEAAADSAAA